MSSATAFEGTGAIPVTAPGTLRDWVDYGRDLTGWIADVADDQERRLLSKRGAIITAMFVSSAAVVLAPLAALIGTGAF